MQKKYYLKIKSLSNSLGSKFLAYYSFNDQWFFTNKDNLDIHKAKFTKKNWRNKRTIWYRLKRFWNNRGKTMEFEQSTKWLLKKIMRDLNEEATTYDFGSKEYEFLSDVVSEIEDAIWAGK